MIKYIFLFSPFFISLSFAFTPEEETKRLSRYVKPIPDSLWKEIASEQFSETYEVSSGDTLYSISDRLFGDSKYWPKIWAVNNNRILNPHLIYPGNKIIFQSGTGTHLPRLGLSGDQDGSLKSEKIKLTQSSRSNEWKHLPRQIWEQVQFKTPPEVDPDGIDRRSVIQLKKPDGFFPPLVISDDEFYSYGKIFSSSQSSNALTKGDRVYVKSQESLDIGDEFSIIEKPEILDSSFSLKNDQIYLHLGIIKITQFQNNVYEAIIKNAFFPIYRDAFIVPKIKKTKTPTPIPGPSPIPGKIAAVKELSSSNLTQHSHAIVDKGSSDGIEPGMIFRAYQYKDPQTNTVITNEDMVFLADFIVTQTSHSFSAVLGINSLSTVGSDSNVILLTDISIYTRRKKTKHSIIEADSGLFDSLDRIDLGDEIKQSEKDELFDLDEIDDSDLFSDDFDTADELDLFDDKGAFDDLDDLDVFEDLESGFEDLDSLDSGDGFNNVDEKGSLDDTFDDFGEFDDLSESPKNELDDFYGLEDNDLNLDDGFEIEPLEEKVSSSAPSKSKPQNTPSHEDIFDLDEFEDDSLDDFDLL